MTTYSKPGRPVIGLITGLLCVTLIAWNHSPGYQLGHTPFELDTVPAKTPKTGEVRDLDKEIEKLDKAIERLENLKTKDWDRLSGQLSEQISKINIDEIKRQTDLAMKAADLNKMTMEAEKALKELNVEQMQKQVNDAMALVKINKDAMEKAMIEVKIDKDLMEKAMAEVKVEVNKELAVINEWKNEDLKAAMDEVKLELDKAKEELKSEKTDLAKELDHASIDIREAKKEISGYQDMIYAMEKDGLLNTGQDYKIVYRDGALYINDKKQPVAVTAKYRKYLKDNLTIKKEKGRFNIGTNEDKKD